MTEKKQYYYTCAGCKRIFFIQSDLNAHVKAMGSFCADKEKDRKYHEDIERETDRERHHIENILADFEKIILNYQVEQIRKKALLQWQKNENEAAFARPKEALQ